MTKGVNNHGAKCTRDIHFVRVLELWAWAMLWWEGLRPMPCPCCPCCPSGSRVARDRVAMGDRVPVPVIM